MEFGYFISNGKEGWHWAKWHATKIKIKAGRNYSCAIINEIADGGDDITGKKLYLINADYFVIVLLGVLGNEYAVIDRMGVEFYPVV